MIKLGLLSPLWLELPSAALPSSVFQAYRIQSAFHLGMQNASLSIQSIQHDRNATSRKPLLDHFEGVLYDASYWYESLKQSSQFYLV